jgi:prepilin peptidase CpaA
VPQFAGTRWGLAWGISYTILIALAAALDGRARRIPNWLVLTLGTLGMVYSSLQMPALDGVWRAAGGIGLGLALWLPFYALGWLGAGDVKFFAAASAWLGPMRALEAALEAAVIGAALAVIWMLWTYGVKRALVILGVAAAAPALLAPPPQTRIGKRTLPYGVALALGALTAAWMPGLFLR